MSAHTPGPWEVLCEVAFDRYIVGNSIKNSITVTSHREDAHLIAAAPDLLSALQKIVNSVPFSHANQQTLDEARSAIAKAEAP
jgi:hypothetical protein